MPTVKEMRDALKKGFPDPRTGSQEEGSTALEEYRESDTYRRRQKWYESARSDTTAPEPLTGHTPEPDLTGKRSYMDALLRGIGQTALPKQITQGNTPAPDGAQNQAQPQGGLYRSSEAVQAELDTLAEQIKAQRETDRQASGWYDKSWLERAGELMTVASGAVQEDGEEAKEDTQSAEVSPELQALLDQQMRLQTELALSQYMEQQVTIAKEAQMLSADLEELNSWPEEDQELLRHYIANRATIVGSADMNKLTAKYGERAREIAESYLRNQNREKAEQVAAWAAETSEGFWGGLGSSILRVGANLVGSVTAPVGYTVEAGNRTGRYSTLDPNQLGTRPLTYAGAVQENVTGNIDEWAKAVFGEEQAGKVASGTLTTLYGAGMSALDSLARIAVGGEWGSLALAATGGFGQTVQQASQQGASPEEAVALGVVVGGLEVLTEKVSLDNLMKQAKGDYGTFTQIVKAALKAGAVEVSEEELNFLCSTLAEAAILQEKSSYNQQIQELVADGMSYQEAKEQAERALINEAAQTAIQSFLSGGMMSGATSVYGNAVNRMQSGRNGGETAQEAVEASQGAENSTAENETDRKRREQDEAIRELVGLPAEPAQRDSDTQEREYVSPSYDELTRKNDIPVVDVGKNTEGKSYAQLKTEALQNANNKKWFDAPHVNQDTGMRIFLTEKTFTHAFSNLRSDFGTDTILAMNHLPELVRDAVMIHAGDPKNPNKPEKRVYTFLAAIKGENGIEPVKLTVKKYDSNSSSPLPRTILEYFKRNGAAKTNSRLYDVEALEVVGIERAETEKEFGASAIVADGQKPNANSAPNSKIKIADLLRLVKGDAEKYVPKAIENAKEENRGVPEGFEAMGAASADFTGKQAFNELLSDENAQPDRPGDVRPMEIPKTDGYGRHVSEFAANAYGAEVTPDAMADRIQELIGDGALGFDTRTNETSLRNAAEAIKKRGMASTRNQITRSVADGKIKDGDIEKALLLYAAYANKKGQAAQDNAAELMVDLAAMANITGRNLQLFKLLRRMTPEGQLMTVQKTVQRNVDKLNGKRGKKDQIQVEIPQELQEDYLEAAKKDAEEGTKETAKKKEEIENAIYLAAASQIKGTWAEKWNTWRYMAMLGNVKTQVRNIVGNAAYIPYTEAKRALGAAMEKFIPKEKRTKAIVGLSEGDRALRNWAKADSKTDAVRDALKYSAKLGDDVTSSKMEEGRRIFDTEILEKTRKLVEKVPAQGDMLFKNREYTEALAGFIKARGYTVADIQSGAVSEAVLNEGRIYAIQEAMKATFNDCNLFSDFVSNFRYKGSNPIGKAVNILGEGIMPFRRTPANIVVRMVENSPVNMARSLWNMATKVRTGEMSAATAIDQMAAGLTGTGAMALGILLASGVLGIKLRGSDVDEDEKRQGHQAYAIEFSINGKEYSYKIDWAAPANLPLFVGANLYDLWENRGEDTGLSAFTSFVYAMGNMFEPMLSLSCMSSLNDALESTQYAEQGEKLYAFFANAVTNYFTQGIPALVRQTYQATQETKQQTFANSDDPLLRDIQRTAANIPFVGAAFQTDSVDQWGEEESRGNWARRLFDAFFNPGTLKKIDTGALVQEITRLNEAQSESVTPPEVPKTISFTDAQGNRHSNRRLTEEEWNTLRTVQGQTAADILNTMIASADYAALTEEQKAEAFGYVYDYAREKGRTAAFEGEYDGMDGWMEGIEGGEAAAIIRKVALGSFSGAFDSLTAGNRAGAVGALEEAYSVYEGLTAEQQKAVAESASGRVADCIAAMNAGVDATTFAGLYQVYYDIGKTDTSAAEQANDWAYELQKAVENGTITGEQRDVLKRCMTISGGYTVGAEKFDSMVESGLDADKADYIGQLMRGIEPQRGYTTVRPVQQAETIAGAKLTEAEKIAVMKLYMNDAQDENLDRMLEMGFDVADYAKAYRIYSDASGQGKKARTIAEFQEVFGVGYDTAKAIYEIYG